MKRFSPLPPACKLALRAETQIQVQTLSERSELVCASIAGLSTI